MKLKFGQYKVDLWESAKIIVLLSLTASLFASISDEGESE